MTRCATPYRRFLFWKEIPHCPVPLGVQRLVHNKGGKGCAGYEADGSAIVANGEHEGADLFRQKGRIGSFHDAGNKFGHQVQDEFETGGGALSLDHVKGDRAHVFPWDEGFGAVFVLVLRKKRGVYVPVDVIGDWLLPRKPLPAKRNRSSPRRESPP